MEPAHQRCDLIHGEESLDEVCGVEVLQPRRGYRFNLDAVLLAHFAAPSSTGRVFELGTGSGIVSLILARKFGVEPIIALELQPRLFRFAQRSVRLNRLEQRIEVVQGDLREAALRFSASSARTVVFNPPYYAERAGILNPDTEKAIARHEIACSLADWIAAAAHLLEPNGRLCVVFPVARMGELVRQLELSGLRLSRTRQVLSKQGELPFRVLLEAEKGEGAEIKTLPPLVVHCDRGLSEELAEMVKGTTSSSHLPHRC